MVQQVEDAWDVPYLFSLPIRQNTSRAPVSRSMLERAFGGDGSVTGANHA